MQIRGRLYCEEIVSTEKKTLRRGNIHAFPWILPHFSMAKLITCTSVEQSWKILGMHIGENNSHNQQKTFTFRVLSWVNIWQCCVEFSEVYWRWHPTERVYMSLLTCLFCKKDYNHCASKNNTYNMQNTGVITISKGNIIELCNGSSRHCRTILR